MNSASSDRSSGMVRIPVFKGEGENTKHISTIAFSIVVHVVPRQRLGSGEYSQYLLRKTS